MIPLPLRARPRNRLELVNAGGPTTGTFDPTITVPSSRFATLQYGDGDSEQISGTELGFSHTYGVDGTWRARLRHVPCREIVSIDGRSDSLIALRNLRRCVRLVSLIAYGNALLSMPLRDVPARVTTLSIGGCPLITGDLSDVPAGVTYLSVYGCPRITGDLSDVPARVTTLSVSNCPLITGDLSDVPAGVTILYAYVAPSISPVGIQHLTDISDIRIDSNNYSTSVVDSVLLAMYNSRMGFTAAAPSLQIGGTNAAPSGTYQNADPPTTGLEYVYKLVNDPDGDGHRKWAISWTGGSAP
jgi:hypothetical protein